MEEKGREREKSELLLPGRKKKQRFSLISLDHGARPTWREVKLPFITTLWKGKGITMLVEKKKKCKSFLSFYTPRGKRETARQLRARSLRKYKEGGGKRKRMNSALNKPEKV